MIVPEAMPATMRGIALSDLALSGLVMKKAACAAVLTWTSGPETVPCAGGSSRCHQVLQCHNS